MRGRMYALLIIIAVIAAIWLLGPVLTPFVIGAALAYICDPSVDRLERLGLSRTAGVVVVFVVLLLGIALLVLLLLPLLEQQIQAFVHNLPRYVAWVQQTIDPWLGRLAGPNHAFDTDALRKMIAEHWSSAGGVASTVFTKAFASGSVLISVVIDLLLVPVIMFYLLRDWDGMTAWIRSQLPRRYVGTITLLARKSDRVLGHFIRGQLLVMVVLGTIYTTGLWLAGLDLALVIGLGAGLVSFIPYVGVISGLLVSTVAMLVQTGDPFQLIWVIVIFGIGQVMEQVVLQPLLLGDAIGLHPVWVIFAVLAGGQLFGFLGVMLALPTAAVVAVILRYALRRWRLSRIYLGK